MDYDPNDLDQLHPLTTAQYDQCVERAKRRIHRRIGKKPEYQDFKLSTGGSWVRRLLTASNTLNGLALVIFTAALVMSSMNIITHTGVVATSGYKTMTKETALSGLVISESDYVAINQVAAIFLAEASMILFIVMFALNERSWYHWRRLPYLLLAMAATIFVIYSNINSKMGTFESILPPIFTIGVGLFLEQLIVQAIQERRDISQRLQAALERYEAESKDITRHPDYLPVLYNEIWQNLVRLKVNKHFADHPNEFKRAAVERELARDRWAYGESMPRIASRHPSRDSRDNYVKNGSLIQNRGASDDVRKLFRDQPDMIRLAFEDPQSVADYANVSKALIYKIRHEFEPKFSTNGQHHDSGEAE